MRIYNRFIAWDCAVGQFCKSFPGAARSLDECKVIGLTRYFRLAGSPQWYAVGIMDNFQGWEIEAVSDLPAA